MQLLDGEPAETWARHEEEIGQDVTTWNEFAKFLLDKIQDPINRSMTMSQRYQDAVQKPGQSVQSFASHLEDLEAMLTPYTEEHRRHHLLMKLRPDIRMAITNYQDIPSTRIGLIALASRLEENLCQTKKDTAPEKPWRKPGALTGEKRRKPEDNLGERRPFSKRQKNDDKGSESKSTNSKGKDQDQTGSSNGERSKPTKWCYNCKKDTHWTNECQRKSGKWKGDGKNSDGNKPGKEKSNEETPKNKQTQ